MNLYNGVCLMDATQQPADAGAVVNVGGNDAVQVGISGTHAQAHTKGRGGRMKEEGGGRGRKEEEEEGDGRRRRQEENPGGKGESERWRKEKDLGGGGRGRREDPGGR